MNPDYTEMSIRAALAGQAILGWLACWAAIHDGRYQLRQTRLQQNRADRLSVDFTEYRNKIEGLRPKKPEPTCFSLEHLIDVIPEEWHGEPLCTKDGVPIVAISAESDVDGTRRCLLWTNKPREPQP